MSKGTVVMTKDGTTIVRMDTGERWINYDRPLQWSYDDNNCVWFNAPCGTTVDRWEATPEDKRFIVWAFEWPEGHEDTLMRLVRESESAEYIEVMDDSYFDTYMEWAR